MHAERLYSIALDTTDAFHQAGIINLLDGLIQDVTKRQANPADASLDQKVSDDAKQLFAALDALKTRDFPPTWRKVMEEELGQRMLFPDAIRNSVEGAFQKKIMDSDLLESLKRLRKEIQSNLDRLTKLHDALDQIGLGTDDLESGQVEFDVAMPREAISDDVGGFGKLLTQLNKELLVLTQILAEPAPRLTINTISTNDFSLAINFDVNLADVVLFILLALGQARGRAKAALDALSTEALKGLPEQILAQSKEWAKTLIKDEIGKIVERLPLECPDSVDAAKLDNQKAPVRAAIEWIESKQELGFNMDVRSGEPPAEPKAEEGEEHPAPALLAKRAKFLRIADRATQLKVIERQSEPILSIEDAQDRPP